MFRDASTCRRTQSGSDSVQIRNLETRSSIIALPMTADQPGRAAPGVNAVLSFQCIDGHCELAKIWDGSTTYTFATSKPGANTRVASVPLKSDRGN